MGRAVHQEVRLSHQNLGSVYTFTTSTMLTKASRRTRAAARTTDAHVSYQNN